MSNNMKTYDPLSGIGIMLVGLTSCSVMALITYPLSPLISTIFMGLAALCLFICIAMVIANMRGE